MPKSILLIAGSSSDSGAGVQIDLKTCQSIGLYACSVLTCVTAQNTRGVQNVEGTGIFEEQLKSVLDDVDISCVKFGVVPDQKHFGIYKKLCKGIQFVLDPVMVAEADTFGFVKEKQGLIEMAGSPDCVISTPNLIECERLTGVKVDSLDTARDAASSFRKLGISKCIIKGIKVSEAELCDYLFIGKEERIFSKRRTPFRYHGSGCSFATAIACHYALTGDVEQSVVLAEQFIGRAIRRAISLGKGEVKVVVP